MAVSSTSSITRWMRALVMWSAASLRATVESPVKGEPSRCCRIFGLLEVAHIDLVEARMADRHGVQGAARAHHLASDLRARIRVRIDAPGAGTQRHNARH